ncbi:hypothetical protein PENTCL1PPCAC_19683, partial [Pristionchus entomophagus]
PSRSVCEERTEDRCTSCCDRDCHGMNESLLHKNRSDRFHSITMKICGDRDDEHTCLRSWEMSKYFF